MTNSVSFDAMSHLTKVPVDYLLDFRQENFIAKAVQPKIPVPIKNRSFSTVSYYIGIWSKTDLQLLTNYDQDTVSWTRFNFEFYIDLIKNIVQTNSCNIKWYPSWSSPTE